MSENTALRQNKLPEIMATRVENNVDNIVQKIKHYEVASENSDNLNSN